MSGRPRHALARRSGPGVDVALAGALSIAAGVLRSADLGGRSLWIDEAFRIWMSELPLGEWWRVLVDIDQHPPLYYLLLRAWLGPDPDEVAVRSLSAVLGTLTVPVVYALGREVGGRRVGVGAAVLLTASPLHVQHSQLASAYAAVTLFAAVALLGTAVLVGREPTGTAGRWWCGVTGAAIAAAALAHNTGLLVGAAVGAVAAVRAALDRRRPPPGGGPPARPVVPPPRPVRPVGPVAALLVAAALWAPWSPFLLAQAVRVDAEFWLPAPTATTLLEFGRDLASARSPGVPAVVVVAVLAGLVAAGATGRLRRGAVPLLLCALLLPPLVELVVSLRRPVFYTPTMLWTVVPLTVLVAAALARAGRAGWCAGLVALVAVNAVSLGVHYGSGNTEDWRGPAARVATTAQAGDLVLFNAGWTQIAFDHYLPDERGDLVRHGVPADLLEAGVLEPRATPGDLPRVRELVGDRDRVWLVYSHEWYTDPDRIVEAELAALLGPPERTRFTGVEVLLFRRDPPVTPGRSG